MTLFTKPGYEGVNPMAQNPEALKAVAKLG